MKYLLCFTFLFTSFSVSAQDSLLTVALKNNAHYLTLNEGELKGPGLDFLKELGRQHHFFMIGEAHGVAENPEFAAALFELYKPFDYKYFATETGPYTAALLEDLSGDNMEDNLSRHFKTYPWSVPFYNWKEENLILKALEINSDQSVLWGLDQEFAASFRMFFRKLADEGKNKASRDLAEQYYERAMKAYEQSSDAQNPNLIFMTTVNDEDFTDLKKAFAGQVENLALLNELQESVKIYQYWSKGKGLESNINRAEMMKRHFMEYYRQLPEDDNGRVMGKFGANHVYKGLNGLNIPDIANFINELAVMEGKKFFNLYTMGKKGTQNAFTPFSNDEADRKAAYDPSGYLDQLDTRSLIAAGSDDYITLLDLRPIRILLFNRKLKLKSDTLKKLIWSYDALMIFPEFTASTEY